MGAAAHYRRSRPSRSRRSGARLAERRRNRKSPLPSPVRIRWPHPGSGAMRRAGSAQLLDPVVALTRAGGRQQSPTTCPRRRAARPRPQSARRAGWTRPGASRRSTPLRGIASPTDSIMASSKPRAAGEAGHGVAAEGRMPAPARPRTDAVEEGVSSRRGGAEHGFTRAACDPRVERPRRPGPA
jgi:hypothetical protein